MTMSEPSWFLDWLTDCSGFASVTEAQAALDAFVAEYNTDRPHQSLDTDRTAGVIGTYDGDRCRFTGYGW